MIVQQRRGGEERSVALHSGESTEVSASCWASWRRPMAARAQPVAVETQLSVGLRSRLHSLYRHQDVPCRSS